VFDCLASTIFCLAVLSLAEYPSGPKEKGVVVECSRTSL
jgi:hypothetical protein